MKKMMLVIATGLALLLSMESAIGCPCTTEDGIQFCEPVC